MTTGSLTESHAAPAKSVTGEYQWCSLGCAALTAFGRYGARVSFRTPAAVDAARRPSFACCACDRATARSGPVKLTPNSSGNFSDVIDVVGCSSRRALSARCRARSQAACARASCWLKRPSVDPAIPWASAAAAVAAASRLHEEAQASAACPLHACASTRPTMPTRASDVWPKDSPAAEYFAASPCSSPGCPGGRGRPSSGSGRVTACCPAQEQPATAASRRCHSGRPEPPSDLLIEG